MTKLYEVVLSRLRFGTVSLNDLRALAADKEQAKAIQKWLDQNQSAILNQLTAQDLVDHNLFVYDATVDEYIANPHNQGIISQLVDFMEMVERVPSDEDRMVLDVGCGTGRDSAFMSIPNVQFRESLMQRRLSNGQRVIDVRRVPSASFDVVGVDGSVKMVEAADEYINQLTLDSILRDVRHRPFFMDHDIHSLDSLKSEVEAIDLSHGEFLIDGIWSCTALFTHTPVDLFEPAMKGAASILRQGGVAFFSYTNGNATGQTEKLLLSSTGHIKYFSQPNPNVIESLANKFGLVLARAPEYNHMEHDGKIIVPNLFVSQFFVKQ